MTTPRTFRQYRFQTPPGACEILFVRHGESAAADPANPFETLDGHGDPPLHEEGIVQAELVCRRLIESGEDFAGVYVTPLQRTQQTAAPLAARLGIKPVVEPDLREVYLGEFEGAEFRRRSIDNDPIVRQVRAEQRWDAIPGAESDDEFTVRVRRGVTRIAAAHPDATAVVFTHGGVIGKVMQLATGSSPFAFVMTDNASISHLVVHEDQWIVRAWNDTGHLGAHFSTSAQPVI